MSKKAAPAHEQLTGLYTAMLDQTIRTNRIVAKGIERVVEEQLDWFEVAIESTRPLATAKQPGDMLVVQADAMKALSEKFVTTTGKLAEIQRETSAELKDVIIDGLKAVNETLPKAA